MAIQDPKTFDEAVATALRLKGYAQSEGSKKGGQQGGKTGETAKSGGQTFKDSEKGFDQNKKKGTAFRKTPFNPEKFCIAHQNYGHATADCSWLKGRLKELSPPPTYTGKGKGDTEAGQSGN